MFITADLDNYIELDSTFNLTVDYHTIFGSVGIENADIDVNLSLSEYSVFPVSGQPGYYEIEVNTSSFVGAGFYFLEINVSKTNFESNQLIQPFQISPRKTEFSILVVDNYIELDSNFSIVIDYIRKKGFFKIKIP